MPSIYKHMGKYTLYTTHKLQKSNTAATGTQLQADQKLPVGIPYLWVGIAAGVFL